jgi:predicted phosphoadenosine phosphosulfate sulfurtransferase
MGKKMLQRKFVETNVYDMAMERINHAFDLFDHVNVSFSGGKDSTVCLNLALEVARERNRLPLRVFFFDEEAIPYQTEDYVRRVAGNPDIDMEWYCLPVKCRNACSRKHPYWWPWGPEDKDKWTRPMPPEGITELAGFLNDPPEARYSLPELNNLLSPAEKWGTVGMIMGIRTQESLTRFRAVVRKPHDNYIINVSSGKSWGQAKVAQNNVSKVYPIYDWKTEDVWTAPKQFGWDYNLAYDVMDKAGMKPHSQRVCPAYGEEPIGSLWQYAVCFPEIWEKMTNRVPGSATAMRYSRTKLYAFGKRPQKPPSMSWQDFVKSFIVKHDEKHQKLIAARIQKEIKAHYAKTSDPILPTAAHHWTGVSWEWLVMIAMRGDFKERKQACFNINLSDIEGHKVKYAIEYEKEKGRPWKEHKISR